MSNLDITNLSWNVEEEEYRKHPALSYSLLAKYEKSGFAGLKALFEPQESEALTFGSMVDTLMTQPKGTFEKMYYVSKDVPSVFIQFVINNVYKTFPDENSLNDISDSAIVTFAPDYQTNWKEETRAKKIREAGEEYYQILKEAKGRIIVDYNTFKDAKAVENILLNSPLTRKYFEASGEVQKYNQIKFKTHLNNIEYKCMFDLLCVNYDKKWILPVDLKTTSFPEYEFYRRYLERRYDIQSKLYWRILNKCLKENQDFKDFKLYDFQFVCVNKVSLNPLVWYDDTCKSIVGTEYLTSTNKKIVLRDPEIIGKELMYYLNSDSKNPKEIEQNKPNSITEWIKKM